MATLSFFFPGNVYPIGYSPSIPEFVDYNPSLEEAVDFDTATIVSTSSTREVFQLANGLKLAVNGTGFAFDSSLTPIGGTFTSVQLLQNNGSTVVQSLTGLSRSLEDFFAISSNSQSLAKWLMNGNDTLNGSSGADDLYGHGGNDTINGGDGDDYVRGGSGTDTYNGGNGFDSLAFNDADNSPTALHGVSINAQAGTATDPWGNSETFSSFEDFRGTRFHDVMTGSAADELFHGFAGADTINGGGGNDTVRYQKDASAGGTHGVTVNLTTGVAIDGFGTHDTLSNIENVRATDYNDVVVGSSVDNVLRAFAGNDSLNGAAGADDLVGGAGNDTYIVDNASDLVDEQNDSGAGIDTVTTSVSFDLAGAAVLGLVEKLTLSGTGAISGFGNSLNNVMAGNSGSNTLAGRGGSDTLIGGAGNDVLSGGDGNDTMAGGAGQDAFLFNTVPNAATNHDTINSFAHVDDTIRLDNAVFTQLVGTGTLSVAQFWASATGVAHDANDRIVYETDTGKIFYDADGNAAGGSVLIATLTGHPTIDNTDFFIV